MINEVTGRSFIFVMQQFIIWIYVNTVHLSGFGAPSIDNNVIFTTPLDFLITIEA